MDDFNYGDAGYMYDDVGMDISFIEESPQQQPSTSTSSPAKKSPQKMKGFSFGVTGMESFLSPSKKDISIVELSSDSPLFGTRPSDSPIFARRPPSFNLDNPTTTFSKPKESAVKNLLNIPENVPFSELADDVFGTKQTTKKVAAATIEHEFFGVYCLISRSPIRNYKNRCYIGYTVDPNRRIVQHNNGREKGGAKKTDSRGPWEMVCIVHGFPNSVSALRFEWAWQNPDKSRRLKEVELKKSPKESQFAYRLRIVCHMLNSDPWKRLALTFRWLVPQEEIPFPSEIKPPSHMKKQYGLVEKSTEKVAKEPEEYQKIQECALCSEPISALSQFVRCSQTELCITHYHTRCLAEHSLKQTKEYGNAIVPIEGKCLRCLTSWRWGDLIRDQQKLIQISAVAHEQYRIANAELLIPKPV